MFILDLAAAGVIVAIMVLMRLWFDSYHVEDEDTHEGDTGHGN